MATADTLYMGFGLEGVSDLDSGPAGVRDRLMGRAIDYLLR